MPLSKRCKVLIEEGYNYSVSHGNNLTNHLPMALIALDKMKATEKNLQHFSNSYKKKLVPFPEDTNFKSITSIEKHLGDQSYFISYLKFFEEQISSLGTLQVVRKYIPLLIKSPSSCAFHCLIRTSYAVSSGLDHEIAIALAYWASEFITFKTKITADNTDFIEKLSNLSLKFENFNFNEGNISTRMKEVDNFLYESKASIDFPKYSLASTANLALNLYIQTENFTLLHGVTATHAFRTLLPYIDDKNLALSHLWQGIILAFLSTGIPLPSFSNVNKGLESNWEDIFKKAVKSTDPHTIKLVYSSWEEWKEYNNPLYISAAYKKVANVQL